MPAFDGRGGGPPWVAATLAAGWGGDVDAARDGNTVSVNISTTRTDWVNGQDIATLPPGFWPSFVRIGFVAVYSTSAVVPVRIYATGVIEAVLGATGGVGLDGCITYVK